MTIVRAFWNITFIRVAVPPGEVSRASSSRVCEEVWAPCYESLGIPIPIGVGHSKSEEKYFQQFSLPCGVEDLHYSSSCSSTAVACLHRTLGL